MIYDVKLMSQDIVAESENDQNDHGDHQPVIPVVLAQQPAALAAVNLPPVPPQQHMVGIINRERFQEDFDGGDFQDDEDDQEMADQQRFEDIQIIQIDEDQGRPSNVLHQTVDRFQERSEQRNYIDDIEDPEPIDVNQIQEDDLESRNRSSRIHNDTIPSEPACIDSRFQCI